MEQFKDIPGYEGRYQASNYGRIKSIGEKKSYKGDRILSLTKDKGYYVVRIMFNGKRTVERVHRLVALTWLDKPSGCDVIDHIDTNGFNNHVNNLRWTTTKGNANNPLTRLHKSKSKQGKNNPMYGVVQVELMKRLAQIRSRTVVQYDEQGCVATYPSAAEAQRLTGIDATSISAVCHGKRKSAGGFAWKFVAS